MKQRFGKARALSITPLGHAILEHPCKRTGFLILDPGKRVQCEACGEVIEVAE